MTAERTASTAAPVLPAELEQFRVGLTGFCYRMLGSPFDAEDAVQDTFVRAWQAYESFDPSRGDVRSWLYSIAANRCVDLLRSARRRELAVDMGPAFRPGPQLGDPLPSSAWVLPIADALVLPVEIDPAERAAHRESVRLAFVAALQVLPASQRACVILRDVLAFSAAETSGILGISVAAVNSALQRARATLAHRPRPSAPLDRPGRELVERYCRAFHDDDIDSLVALLREDVVTSMPPYPWWLRGRTDVEASLRASGNSCRSSRLVVVDANGTVAFARYAPGKGGRLQAFSLTVTEWREGRVASTVTFLETPHRLLAMFGLTDEFEEAPSYHLV